MIPEMKEKYSNSLKMCTEKLKLAEKKMKNVKVSTTAFPRP